MKLTSTQIGSIAENLVANEVMIDSGGRLSPFQPIADDDGIDVLFYDKVTGGSIPIQIKARTKTVNKPGSKIPGNTVHFEVRKATLDTDRNAYLLCVLLDSALRKTERAWLVPLKFLPKVASNRDSKYVIRANRDTKSNDKYKRFQCASMSDVCNRIIEDMEATTQ